MTNMGEKARPFKTLPLNEKWLVMIGLWFETKIWNQPHSLLKLFISLGWIAALRKPWVKGS
jgi:hypothetical protein